MKIFWMSMLLSSVVIACPAGTIPYQGLCADEPVPKDTVVVAEAKPSDEKPSRHPEPAYQRGEFKVSDGIKERESAKKQDDDIDNATTSQGKKAASLR
jgi:hypothetical protein